MKIKNLEKITEERKKVKDCMDELSIDNKGNQSNWGDLNLCGLSNGEYTPTCRYLNSSVFTIDEKGYFRNICKYNNQ